MFKPQSPRRSDLLLLRPMCAAILIRLAHSESESSSGSLTVSLSAWWRVRSALCKMQLIITEETGD